MSHRRRAGVTLVELMITVAMVGITVGALGSATRRAQLVGLAQLQQEQAQLLLDHHAQRLLDGADPSPDAAEQLAARLPGAVVSQEPGDGVVTLAVTWTDAAGAPARRALTVFSR